MRGKEEDIAISLCLEIGKIESIIVYFFSSIIGTLQGTCL